MLRLTQQEVLDLFARVLSHYSGKAKIVTMKDDDGSPAMGKELMDADIQKLDDKIGEAKRELASARGNQDFIDAIRDYQPILKDAFTVYVEDLKSSRTEFLKRFGGSSLKTENLDGELRLAEQYLSDISAQHSRML